MFFSTNILLLKHEFVCVRVRSVATNAAAYIKLSIVILALYFSRYLL